LGLKDIERRECINLIRHFINTRESKAKT